MRQKSPSVQRRSTLKLRRLDFADLVFHRHQVRPFAWPSAVCSPRRSSRGTSRNRCHMEEVRVAHLLSLCPWTSAKHLCTSADAADVDEIETITRLLMPVLALPPQDSFITAHLRVPPSVSLSTSTRMTLSITNSHPSATATTLCITVDSSDSFIWAGPKSTHVAALPPNDTAQVVLDVVPVSSGPGAGSAELPKVRLWEGTGDDKEELDVVILSDRGERVEIGGAAVHIRP